MQLHLFDDKEGPSPERTRDRSGGVASKPRAESGRAAYRQALFSGVPLLTTRLVREQPFRFAERTRVSSPAEVAQVFIPYFADKDREECLAALVDTAHTLIGVVRLSVGGLAASIV